MHAHVDHSLVLVLPLTLIHLLYMYVYVLQLCVQRIVDATPTAPATTRRTMGTSTCVSVTMDTLEIPQTTVMVSSGITTLHIRTNASH